MYDLTPRWRVADCSRGVPFAHINGARREFPPAVEAHALHGACDAFEFYINVAPSDSGMKSYVQLASFWRGNGGAGLDVNIMPDTCFEAFVFLEGVRSAGVFPAGALPVSFDFEGYVDVDERGIATSYNGVFDRLKARGVPIPVADAVLIDYERDAGRVAQACGRAVLLRFAVLRVDDVFGLRHRRLQSVIPLRCAEPHEPHEPRLLGYIIGGLHVFIG